MASPFSGLGAALDDLLRRKQRPAGNFGKPPTTSEATSASMGMFGAEEGPYLQNFNSPESIANLADNARGLLEVPGNLLRGLWQSKVDAWNAVLPASVSPNRLLPTALQGRDAPLPANLSGETAGVRVRNYANAKSLGLVESFEEKLREQEIRRGAAAATFGEGIGDKTAAGANLALQVLTPIPEAKVLLKGEVELGMNPFGVMETRPATGGDYTSAIATGVMKTLPAAALFSRFFSGRFVAGLGKNPNATLKRTMTAREAASPNILERVMAEEMSPGRSELAQTAMELEPNRMAFGDAVRIVGQTVKNDLYAKVFAEARKADGSTDIRTQVTDILRGVAEKPDVLSPELLGEMAVKYDMPLEQVPLEIGRRLRDEATMTGLFQSVLSAAEAIGQTSLWKRALDGDVVAREALRAQGDLRHRDRRIDAARGKEGTLPNIVERVATGAAKLEDARRVALAGIQASTTVRNTKSFAVNHGSRSLADRLVAWSYGLNPDDADVSASGFHYDYIRDHVTALEAAGGIPWHEKILGPIKHPVDAAKALQARRKIMTAVLMELPKTTGRMFDNMSFDVAAGSLQGFLEDFKPKNYSDRISWVKGMLTAGSRTAEITTRKIRFFSKLETHAERLGYGDIDGVLKTLQREDSIPDDLRYAIADAEVDALKSTFGYRYPNTGFMSAGAILDGYSAMYPISSWLTTPFPRFIVNSWKMLEETSPHHWMYLFNKDFRKILQSHAKNDFASYEGRETLARGLTSGMMMMGAYALRSGMLSNIAKPGPGYSEISWQVGPYAGQTVDAREQMESFNQYAPFDKYLLVADAAVKLSRGAKPQDIFTANELFNAVTSVQRFDEIAIFDFPNLIRSFSNAQSSSIGEIFNDTGAKVIGRWASGFTVPARTLRDIESMGRSALGQPDINSSSVSQDTTSSKLFGPAVGNLPELGGLTDRAALAVAGVQPAATEAARAQQTLPARVSMWDGMPEYEAHPALHTLAGTTIKTMTPLQVWVQSQPGLDATQLHTTFKSPNATNLVDQRQGEILREVQGPLMSEITSGALADMDYETRNWMVMGLLKEIRHMATDAAKAEHPEWFIGEDVAASDLPAPLKKIMSRIMTSEMRKALGDRLRE